MLATHEKGKQFDNASHKKQNDDTESEFIENIITLKNAEKKKVKTWDEVTKPLV